MRGLLKLKICGTYNPILNACPTSFESMHPPVADLKYEVTVGHLFYATFTDPVERVLYLVSSQTMSV